MVDEDGIIARVDMVRLEALAEAAYDAMYEARLHGAKNRYEEARFHFDGAIEAARQSPLDLVAKQRDLFLEEIERERGAIGAAIVHYDDLEAIHVALADDRAQSTTDKALRIECRNDNRDLRRAGVRTHGYIR